jgi:hypothetical protein
MELTYVTIVILASLIFVLAGMVGYLYWQQTNMLQHLQSLALALAAVAEQMRPPEVEAEPVHVTKEDEDDRVTVPEDQVEVVEGPPKTPTATSADQDDVDDLQEKTTTELRDLLTKKGIPYGKRDSKSVLIQLIKATA